MEQKQKVEILKALADDARLSIVRKLAANSEPVTSCNVVLSCELLGNLSQPAASHHFNKLVKAGVVRERKQGTQKVYSLATDVLDSIGVDASKL